VKKSLIATQNIFSTMLKFTSLPIQNTPSGLRRWICGRFASQTAHIERKTLNFFTGTFDKPLYGFSIIPEIEIGSNLIVVL
jgi:hypothetical protein